MTDYTPGADELRMKAILKDRGVGPDAPHIPPKPTGRPRDWLDDILNTKPAPEAPPKPKSKPAEKPGAPPKDPAGPVDKTTPKPPARNPKNGKKKQKRPGPSTPHSPLDIRQQSPRQSLMDAWDAVPYRLKWLAYHLAAAYLGWSLGLVGWATYVTAWAADGHLASVQAIFWYLIGAAAFLLHHATRGIWWPVAFLAAVPATSTVVGVLLYGTPHP